MSKDFRTDFDSLPLTMAFLVDSACLRFEADWRTGLRPRIEDYLACVSDSQRLPLLRELLALDLELREDAGECPIPEEYLARFPGEATRIEAVFDARNSGSDLLTTELLSTDSVSGDRVIEAVLRSRLPFPASRADRQRQDPAEDANSRSTESDRNQDPIDAPNDTEIMLPKKIGRYTLLASLGKGTYGRVYLAWDEELRRDVAIKIPRLRELKSESQIERFLNEARAAAGLNHPAIVTVYDVGRMDGDLAFIVMEYIEGATLSQILRRERLSHVRSAELMVQTAEAVHFANRRGLVHRDLKAANILIDPEGRPHVADFGLAIREDLERPRGGEIVGTPAYMAPEQVRGEEHRLDGRTDVWGLGVILYQMLTGRQPFAGNRGSTFVEILRRDPKPPRQIDQTIPEEIERICLKCLSKRMADRYPTAGELADDLRHWLAHRVSRNATAADERSTARVVPKGLRSFDAHDADFFPELLSGPRDRDGRPDCIRFWTTRIEDIGPEPTFGVGLIYGPSGCGKSSLVKAGILPRLADHVTTVYVESTPADTEIRLLASMRRRFQGLPITIRLHDAVAELREGRGLPAGKKVLIVLDQFEQWLSGREDGREDEITAALRQCDGHRVQCLLLVRDDFWMAITRLMHDLEVRLVEGRNSAAVDLFGPDHARKVLFEFGRAFGRLPDDPDELTSDQARFLDRSVAGLKRRDGKIIPVRLSLFGEMVRIKPWTPATLKAVGGTDGIGVAFLDETFDSPTAPPEHRLHQQAAQAVLRALLPENGLDIKGSLRPHRELLEASGYLARPAEFDELLRILDNELRLVTPSEPEGTDSGTPRQNRPRQGQKYYQLTHDELVPALRLWLTRKQRETLPGRAEIRLAERSDLWNGRPEGRHLPSLWEWAGILVLTKKARWTDRQRTLMNAATRHHARKVFMAASLLLAATIGWVQLERRHEENARAIWADGLVEKLLDADITRVPAILGSIGEYRTWTDPALIAVSAGRTRGPEQRLRADLGLLPVGKANLPNVMESLLTANPETLVVIRDLLKPSRALVESLWSLAADENTPRIRRFRAACALAAYDRKDERWGRVAKTVADQLVLENPYLLKGWINAFRPVRDVLIEPLAESFRRPPRLGEPHRYIASLILVDYAGDDLERLVELAKVADGRQFAELFPRLDGRREEAVSLLRNELEREPAPDPSEDAKDSVAMRRANAAAILLRLGQLDLVWPLLRHTPDPRLRSHLIHVLSPLGVSPQVLAARIEREPDHSSRRALILGLGEFDEQALPQRERIALAPQLRESFRNDPDPGVHSAVDLLLRKWGLGEELKAMEAALTTRDPVEDRRWYVNGAGLTMVVIHPAERPVELKTRKRIGRTYAIASEEVTVAQFLRCGIGSKHETNISPEPDCPVNAVDWYEAAAYCRWLSDREKIPDDQMCYPPVAQIRAGMELPADYLKRSGYRLPTESEWEYAARAWAVTRRFFGNSDDLMASYAWDISNSEVRSWPVGRLKPNDLGLFDVYGNVMEWCHDVSRVPPSPGDDEEGALVVNNSVDRAVRGGTFIRPARALSSDQRDSAAPKTRFNSMGFRVARTCPSGH